MAGQDMRHRRWFRVILLPGYIVGPAIGPVMSLFEKMHPMGDLNGDARLFAPLARILIPRHVYRLLTASLTMISILARD